MSSIRKQALTEPLVDVVDPKQVVTSNCMLKVCFFALFILHVLFTGGLKGALVDIKDTIKGFNAIMDGEYDHLPEMAFNLVGSIEQASEKGEKMLAEAKG
jgi:F0F1-type ATP synthase beta subunit